MEAHRHQLGLERDTEVAFGVVEAAQRLLEHLRRRPEVADRRSRAAQVKRDLGPQAGIAHRRHRLPQMGVEAVSLAVGCLCDAELVKHDAALRVGRWLLDRAPQVMGGRSGVARAPTPHGRPPAAPLRARGRQLGGRRSRCRATRSLSAPRAVSSLAASACSAWRSSGGICS